MALGTQVGAYRLIERIGEGGMGTVWLAEHTMLGRRAAVKVLHASYSTQPEIVARFFNEARAATAINDPGIVQIFDFGHHTDGSAYIVMELLDGEPLDHRIARGPLPVGDALRVMRQVASALGAAHARGIVHRDLKPENIFLVRDPEVPGGERAKLLDFGIAKLATGTSNVKTSTSAVMGTPTYMSPEQCRGAGQVDQRADVYSLGCVLYRLLVGRPPFDAEGVGDIIVMHMRDPAPVPSASVPSIPPAVDDLVLRCMAKDPAERYASGADLASAIGLLVTQPQLDTRAHAIASMPTTLSGAAATTPTQPPASRRHKGLILGIAGVVVAGGITAALVLARGSSTPAQTAVTPPPQPAVAVQAAPPPQPNTPPPPIVREHPNWDGVIHSTEASLDRVVAAFPAWARRHASSPCPSTEQVVGHEVLDGWGHAITLTCTDQPDDFIVGARSAGIDGHMGTDDDLLSWQRNPVAGKGARWTPKRVAAAKAPPKKPTTKAPKPAASDDIPDER
jgi:serine/threonine-protein kinase